MLLFMMPTWSAPSELWMRRMLDSVLPRVGVIACYEAPVEEYCGVRVINLGTRRDEASIALGKAQLRQVLASGKVSAVLVHYLTFALRYEDVLKKAGLGGVPIAVHGHGYDLTWDLMREGVAVHGAGYREDVVRLSRWVTIFANSRASEAKLREIGVGPESIVVKYLGVPVGEYAEPVRQEEAMQGGIGPAMSGGTLDCLYLGRLVDFKGPLETLRVFELAAERGMKGRLRFAGGGPLGKALAEAVAVSKVRDRVFLLGEVNAAQGDILRRHHQVFVSHSQLGAGGQEEALGVAYLEALAAGLPVVSARGGSLPEVVRDGATGLLVDPGDIEGQARRLISLAKDREVWEAMSRAAHADAARRFSSATERETLFRWLDRRQAA